MFMQEISIIIILVWQEVGLVRPTQQKIKLILPD